MNTSKQPLLGRLVPSISLFLLILLGGCATSREMVVDSWEEIIIYTDQGPIKVRAKIDTGAKTSSIDRTFVEKYGLDPFIEDTGDEECPHGQQHVTNAHGEQCRERVTFSFTLKGNVHQDSVATVSNRGDLSTLVLIGKSDTAGRYLVRPVINGLDLDDEEAEEEKKD